MNKPIIELIGVNKTFEDGKFVAVDNFNLDIKKGEFVTFLGPSGCGKTTVLRMIAGFEMPTKGQILLNGKDITNTPPYKRPINTVFQRYALFPHLDVFDNVAFGLKYKRVEVTEKGKDGKTKKYIDKLTKEEIADKVKRALKIVDLEELGWRSINALSGGQQQRVAIARAIVNEPEILLLDEPLGALDLKMRQEMQLELKDMHRKLGITFIYVTHDQEEALTMADRIVVIQDGMIQQVGTPTEIYNEPSNAFVANFIGDSNIFTGTIEKDHKVRFAGASFRHVDDGFETKEKVDVVIRPEDFIIKNNGKKGTLSGVITDKIFKGVHFEYSIKSKRNEIIVHSTQNYEVGSEVSLSVDKDNIHIMKKEFTSNIFEGYINKNNQAVFAGGEFDVDVTQLYPDSKLDKNGYLVTKQKERIDLNDVDIKVDIPFDAVEINDNPETSQTSGEIIQIVPKADHYQIIVRYDEDNDFIVDTDYLWNEHDIVGINVKKDDIKIKLVEKHNEKKN